MKRSQARINDILDNDDVFILDRDPDVFLDMNGSRRCSCIAVARYRHEIDLDIHVRGHSADEVGKKNKTAFQNSDQCYRASGVVCGDLASHLRNAPLDLRLCNQNGAQSRFHSAASLWYKRG